MKNRKNRGRSREKRDGQRSKVDSKIGANVKGAVTPHPYLSNIVSSKVLCLTKLSINYYFTILPPSVYQEIPRSSQFKYLGSILQKDGELNSDVKHRIQAGWQRWRSASGVLCDKNIPLKLKGKLYRTAIRPALLYGTECWAAKKSHTDKMSVAEMRMLRWMCGHTRMDKVRNEVIRTKVGVAPLGEKMQEHRLRWFGHVQRRPIDAPVRRVETLNLGAFRRAKGRPRKTWEEVIRKDMEIRSLTGDLALDRNEWRRLIHVDDST